MSKIWTVYVLKSKNYNWIYVGMTSDLRKRLKEHNRGRVKSTKAYAPFRVIWSKEFSNISLARDCEKKLKIRCNKERLLKDLGEIAGVAESVDAQP